MKKSVHSKNLGKRLGLLTSIILGAFFVTGIFYYLLGQKGSLPYRTHLKVQSGMTLRPILSTLHEEKVLRYPRLLYAYARLHNETDIKVGEYEFEAKQSALEILDLLNRGQIELASFTLPEGYDHWQVRNLLSEQNWMSVEVFNHICTDQALLKQHDIPGPSCEGYLFPETYTFAKGIAPNKIFEAFYEMYQKVYQEVTAMSSGPLNLDRRSLTTLASIVEKETGAASERPHIACVFYNRLKANPPWRLQTDPSVIYAARLVDENFNGNLKREHLRRLDSPYNTYRIYGLPPGPIANPGRAALQSVVQPVTCKEYFFVSMNNGFHQFCETLDCHNRAVDKWQIQYFKARRP